MPASAFAGFLAVRARSSSRCVRVAGEPAQREVDDRSRDRGTLRGRPPRGVLLHDDPAAVVPLGERREDAFDFERADERAAMGELLGLIVERNRPETGLMISALVHYLGENDAGPGFYVFAQDLGLLAKNASQDDKLTFWVEQVSALHRYYARP